MVHTILPLAAGCDAPVATLWEFAIAPQASRTVKLRISHFRFVFAKLPIQLLGIPRAIKQILLTFGLELGWNNLQARRMSGSFTGSLETIRCTGRESDFRARRKRVPRELYATVEATLALSALPHPTEIVTYV